MFGFKNVFIWFVFCVFEFLFYLFIFLEMILFVLEMILFVFRSDFICLVLYPHFRLLPLQNILQPILIVV